MEKFSLKWNDFQSNVSRSFGLLRSEEYLHDVRLMSEDYHEVSAHRLILSACSEYFRNIFKNSKKQDTLICLDGITNEDLRNVLDYIYLGEAHIFQDKLDRFLSVAEKLKLEGLLSKDDETSRPESQQTSDENETETSTEEDTNNMRNSHQRKVPNDFKQIVQLFNKEVDCKELDLKIKENVKVVEDGSRKCSLCNKVVPGGGGFTNFRNHFEKYHMEGLSFGCPNCYKTFSSRASLRMHKLRTHKPKPEEKNSEIISHI